MRFLLPAAFLSLASGLAAQTVDTLGSTSVLASSGKAKTNIIRVDKTVLMLNLELWLDIPGVETLTFFVYRHNSQNGNYNLEWTKPVNVNGTGVGPAWYSTGPIAIPLVTGNHYGLGVAWPGTLTYWYLRGTSGQPFSFGAWYSGRTPTNPPLQTSLAISGVDIAQYYMRFSTVPMPAVVSVGTGCGTTPPPRLVATSVPTLGANFTLELVGGPLSGQSLFILGSGPTLTNPIQLLGCPFYVDLFTGPSVNVSVPVSATGLGTLSIPIPNNPILSGARIATQSAFLSGALLALTNAIDLAL